jgi:hypothetical protein
MGLLSILLSALAIVCAGVGVLTTPFPVLGLIFAFGAPVLAVAGVMLGGSAMSKAKRAGQTNETAKIGVILNAIAFVPSLLVALTCGVCNALFSTGNMQVQRDIRFGTPFGADGGVRPLPPPQRSAKPDPDGTDQPAPGDDPGSADPNPQSGGRQPRDRRPAPGSQPTPGDPGAGQADPQAPAPGDQRPPPGSALPPPPLPPGPGK